MKVGPDRRVGGRNPAPQSSRETRVKEELFCPYSNLHDRVPSVSNDDNDNAKNVSNVKIIQKGTGGKQKREIKDTNFLYAWKDFQTVLFKPNSLSLDKLGKLEKLHALKPFHSSVREVGASESTPPAKRPSRRPPGLGTSSD